MIIDWGKAHQTAIPIRRCNLIPYGNNAPTPVGKLEPDSLPDFVPSIATETHSHPSVGRTATLDSPTVELAELKKNPAVCF